MGNLYSPMVFKKTPKRTRNIFISTTLWGHIIPSFELCTETTDTFTLTQYIFAVNWHKG